MRKAIILLSGTPTGKNRFAEVAKQKAWLWNINYKNVLADRFSDLLQGEDRDKTYYRFVAKILDLANKFYDAEKRYLWEKATKFSQDEDEAKIDKEGNKFEIFLLIMHGVSRELIEPLKNDFGVFEIEVEEEKSKKTELKDLHLFEDNPEFENQALNIIEMLSKENE